MTISRSIDAAGAAPAARPRLVALVVAVAFFMQMLDGTIVTTSLPQMALAFDTPSAAMSIGVTVYMLTMAVLIPLSGWLGDRFGARRVFMAAIAVFTFASLLCGLAADLPQFVAARALQGFGGALMTPVGRTIVLRNAPKSELVRAIAMITWPALIAPVLGPLVGGVIVTWADWRWNFFLNLPIGVAGLLLVSRFVPDERAEAAGPFDVTGFLLSASALGLLLTGLESVGRERVQPVVAAASIAAGGALMVLSRRHLSRAPHPLFDLSAFRLPTFRLATLGAGTGTRAAINAAPFLLPLLFQTAFGWSAVRSGVFVLVYFAGNLGMKVVTTPLLRMFGFRTILVANGLVAAASLGGFAFVSATTGEAALAALLLVAGLSRSLEFTALNTIAFADVGPEQRASASTISAMAQQLSMLLGVAVAAAILNLCRFARNGTASVPADFAFAFLALAVIGIASALRFLALAPDAGSDVSGHRPAKGSE
ncbi:MFS transporter [Aureimonas leprariae]|uniref:Multidrug efflux MFS transporter n=1 Tax=Plantimonas leprariae TaxID=2615207 RepID=A0A7V7PMZ4_9HYPH|nr:MFS transporter [Aureimonas leprariae]KAB0678539.1 multidrug efflux MFS transporter [Aureimonas leprariae]